MPQFPRVGDVPPAKGSGSELAPPLHQVSNQGQSLRTLGSAFLNLQWPHETPNGKWLLYPVRLELQPHAGPRVACSPATNPLQLALVGGPCPLHSSPSPPTSDPLLPTGAPWPQPAGSRARGNAPQDTPAPAPACREEEEHHPGECSPAPHHTHLQLLLGGIMFPPISFMPCLHARTVPTAPRAVWSTSAHCTASTVLPRSRPGGASGIAPSWR